MEHIYQASDLASKRRELMDAARAGFAQIRDTDGAGLVLIPQHRFQLLTTMREHLARLLTLESALERSASERKPADLGELAWLLVFDDDDQQEFRRELVDALVRSLANDSADHVEMCIREWKTTARALSNARSRKTLTARGDAAAFFEEVERPG